MMGLVYLRIRTQTRTTIRPINQQISKSQPRYLCRDRSMRGERRSFVLDRGEQLDWFGSGEIIIEAIIAASAFYRRRNTLVSESVDSFLPCHHAVSILRSLRNLVRTHGGRWHRDVVI